MSLSRARLESWVGLTIDPGQHKDKNGYYHSFKIWFKIDLTPGPG